MDQTSSGTISFSPGDTPDTNKDRWKSGIVAAPAVAMKCDTSLATPTCTSSSAGASTGNRSRSVRGAAAAPGAAAASTGGGRRQGQTGETNSIVGAQLVEASVGTGNACAVTSRRQVPVPAPLAAGSVPLTAENLARIDRSSRRSSALSSRYTPSLDSATAKRALEQFIDGSQSSKSRRPPPSSSSLRGAGAAGGRPGGLRLETLPESRNTMAPQTACAGNVGAGSRSEGGIVGRAPGGLSGAASSSGAGSALLIDGSNVGGKAEDQGRRIERLSSQLTEQRFELRSFEVSAVREHEARIANVEADAQARHMKALGEQDAKYECKMAELRRHVAVAESRANERHEDVVMRIRREPEREISGAKQEAEVLAQQRATAERRAH